MSPWHQSLLSIVLVVAAVLTCVGYSGAQGQPQTPLKYQEFLVDEGGVFEIVVHPGIVTVLYFPGPVRSAINSDERHFVASVMDDSVVLRPVADIAPTAEASLALITGAFRVSVILRVAASASEAVAQVSFKKRAAVEAFNSKVAAEVERIRSTLAEEYDKRHRDLDREIQRRTEQNIIERLLKRHEILDLNRIARNDDSIIVRISRGVWVGHELLLFFAIQNRDNAPYRLDRVWVSGYDPKLNHAGQVVFHSGVRPSKGLLGIVPVNQYAHGVVCVRNADRLAGEPITLYISEPRGRRSVHVEGVSW